MHVYNLKYFFRIIAVVSIDIIVSSPDYYLKLIRHYTCMILTEFAKRFHFTNLECSGVVNAHVVEII